MVELLTHLRAMAAYNAWANRRLYAAAAALPDAAYRQPAGAYFGSLHGTLNHVLVADRIWLRRLTGTGEAPDRLDAILFAELGPLRAAREAEDARLEAYVTGLSAADLEASFSYATTSGRPQRQPRWEVLVHLFNHQTHHRGQAHAILTRLGVTEPPSLDLLAMQRERAASSAPPGEAEPGREEPVELARSAGLELPAPFAAELAEARGHIRRLVEDLPRPRSRGDEPAHVFAPARFRQAVE